MSFMLTKKGTTGTTQNSANIVFPAVRGKTASLISITGYATAATEKFTGYSMSGYSASSTAAVAATVVRVDDSAHFTNGARIVVQAASATLTGSHVYSRLLATAPATSGNLRFTQALSAADPVAVDDYVFEMANTLGDVFLMEQLQRQSLAGLANPILSAPKGSPILLVPNTPSTSRIDSATVVYE